MRAALGSYIGRMLRVGPGRERGHCQAFSDCKTWGCMGVGAFLDRKLGRLEIFTPVVIKM